VTGVPHQVNHLQHHNSLGAVNCIVPGLKWLLGVTPSCMHVSTVNSTGRTGSASPVQATCLDQSRHRNGLGSILGCSRRHGVSACAVCHFV